MAILAIQMVYYYSTGNTDDTYDDNGVYDETGNKNG